MLCAAPYAGDRGGELGLLEVPEVPEAMRCVLICMLEAVEGELYLLEAMDVMRCALLCILEAVEGTLCFAGGDGGARGDAMYATLYAGGCGG